MKGTGIITLNTEMNSEILQDLSNLGLDVNKLLKSEFNEYLVNEIETIPTELPSYMKNFVFIDNENNCHYATYAGKYIRGITLPINPAELFNCIDNDIEDIQIDKNYHITLLWKDKNVDAEFAEKIRQALVVFANNSNQIDNEISKLINSNV